MTDGSRHDVIFYDDRDLLDERVAEFVLRSLADGHLTAVISTRSTLAVIDAAARDAGIDVEQARVDGRLVCYDAHETLTSLRTPTGLDWDAVNSLAASLTNAARSQGRTLKLFGEMVALVWADGEPALAVQLEHHWDDLAARGRFDVLCAYPADAGLTANRTSEMNVICDAHDSHRREHANAGAFHFRAFEADSATVRDAREFVRDSLVGRHSDDFVDTLVLVASELAANAVEHANSPYAVELGEVDTGVEISVRDLSSTSPRSTGARVDYPSGRGMGIVAALCRGWQSTRTPHGKLVCACVPGVPLRVALSSKRDT